MRIALGFIIAFVMSLLLTPMVRELSRRLGAVAKPNNRTIHKVPIPNLGGIAIYISTIIALLLIGGQDGVVKSALIIGGFVITLVGVIDDLYVLRPWQKALGQLLSAIVVVYLGVTIRFLADPFTGHFRVLGWFAVPITILWVVSFENLVNFSDGLDGLAGGIAGITALVTVIATAKAGVYSISTQAAVIAGSVLGFLPYNFHPASIFMGDSGAMFLGLALSVLAVQGMVKSAVALTMIAPVLALFVPISDLMFAVVRRKFSGRPVSQADNDHIHHRLVETGMGQKKAVLLIYTVSVIFGGLGLLSDAVPVGHGSILMGAAVLGLLFAGYKMGILTINVGKRDKKHGM